MQSKKDQIAEETAKRVHAYIKKMAERRGENPESVKLMGPHELRQKGLESTWVVRWEEGPCDWPRVFKLQNLIDKDVYAEAFNEHTLAFTNTDPS